MARTLEIVRGASKLLKLTFTNPASGLPLNLTGSTIWFTVRPDYGSPVTFAKSTDVPPGGISLKDVPNSIDANTGTVGVMISPPDTAGLANIPLTYVFDTVLVDPDGNEWYPSEARGVLKILPSVTQLP